MTRNFKQHGRDDERPYSRQSSDRYEGEQSSRPARPRPNRASVDRAWENGARQQHADYHPRNPHNTQNARNAHNPMPRQPGQPYQPNRRYNTSENASSTPDSRNYRQPPFQRQENRRFDDRPPRRYEGPRPYDSGHRTSEGGYNRERPRYSREGEQQDRRPSSYRDQERRSSTYRDQEHRSSYRDEQRAPRPYTPRPYAPREDARGYGGAPQRSSRADYPNRAGGQDRRFDRRENRPETRNPRFQSRPAQFSPQPRPFRPNANDDELFEGDYERFDARDHTAQRQERHVTELPDGRVLKGNRKEQREAAAFWTDVNEEVQELIPNEVKDTSTEQPAEPTPAPTKRAATGKKVTSKTRTTRTPKATEAKSKRAASETGEPRARKTPAKAKSVKPAKGGTRPSQRGYKWPQSE